VMIETLAMSGELPYAGTGHFTLPAQ
jgi:hypothetical protein